MRTSVLSSSLLVAALLLAGCGSGRSDKAGGTSGDPTVLTLANSLGEPRELRAFAEEVERRSKGSLRIRMANHWREGQTDYERGLVRDVARGKADLGWVGSRAWSTFGVHDFDALTAPMLVDSYALERAVVRSPVVERMLPGIERFGIVGLGVLPGPLRYALAARRPLLRPSDFAGVRVGHQPGGSAVAALRALGATPVVIPSGGEWRGLDAVEQQVVSISGNSYERHAKHLTSNVVLWPRPLVVFAGKGAMPQLSSEQRAVLRDAMSAAVDEADRIGRKLEADALADLCTRGIKLASASRADVDALREALAPVTARLRRVERTNAAITAIEKLRGAMEPEQPLSCGDVDAGAAAVPDGTYTTRLTREDVHKGDVDHELASEAGLIARSTLQLTLRGGRLVQELIKPDGTKDVGVSGTYSTYRDRFIVRATVGDSFSARFSVTGDTLRFSDVEPRGSYALAWQTKPWTRKGD